MSEVTPAEWRKHCFALGVAAVLSSLLIGAEKTAAEQYVMTADANTAAIAGGSVAAKLPLAYAIRVVKLSSDRLKLRGLIDTALWLTKKMGRTLPGLVSRAGGFPK